jgi:RNA polymerase sigma factor (sigma-70 family)
MLQAELEMLVLKAQQGDEPALLRLFEHYQPALVQFAYRVLPDHSLAQDAVQNAWLKTLNNLRGLHNPAVFKCWIYRAVKWSATDLLRQCHIQQQRSSTQEVDELVAEQQAIHDELSDALQGLPADEYQAIYLFYFAQLTVVEIALVQEVPVGTVKTRLFRAKAKLKVTLENTDEY